LSIYGNKILNDPYRFDNDEFHVQSIISSLSDNGSKSRNSSNTSDTEQILQNNNHTISNAVIRDLRLTGKYEVIISFNGSLVLPSKMGSYYDYIAASIPTGFDMIVKLHDEATAEFIAENGPHGQSIRLTGNTKVNFYNVSDAQDKKDISVLLKSPQIRVIDGITNFEKLFMFDPYSRLAGDGGLLLNFKGDMLAKFDYVDNYDETDSSGGWTHTQPLSYLKSIHFSKDNNYNNDKKINLEFPADISPLAKKEGGVVPVQSALLSEKNIVVSISITAVAVALLTIRMYRRPQRLGLK
jgi:hypothetical protein